MTNLKILFLFLLISYSTGITLLKSNCLIDDHFKFNPIMEKEFSIYEDSNLNILSGSDLYTNYFRIFESSTFEIHSILPGILLVDKDTNIYIRSGYSIKVYNNKGNFVYNYKIPLSFIYIHLSEDNYGNLYLFLNNTTDSIETVFKLSSDHKSFSKLSDEQKMHIDSNQLPFYITNKIYKLKNTDFFYRVNWSSTIRTIFNIDSGRYISPEDILIYKYYNINKFITSNDRYRDRYLFAKFNISKLINNKVIYLNSCYTDGDGNIFLSGETSNEAEVELYNNLINEYNNLKNGYNNLRNIKVNYPIFFIWELERQD